MTYKKYIAVLVGFVVTLFSNTLLAMFVLAPINTKLGISRTMEQGLNFPALLSGYFLIAVFMVWQLKDKSEKGWLRQGAITGFMTAIAFNIASYMVVSGWSTAHGEYMLFASSIDSIATVLGAVSISWVLHEKNEARY